MGQQTAEQALAKQLYGLLHEDHLGLTEDSLVRTLRCRESLYEVNDGNTESVDCEVAQAILTNDLAKGIYDQYLKTQAAAGDDEAFSASPEVVAYSKIAEEAQQAIKKRRTQEYSPEPYYELHTKLSFGTGVGLTFGGLGMIAVSSYYQYLQNQGMPIPEAGVPVSDAMTSYWSGTAALLMLGITLLVLAKHLYRRSAEIAADPRSFANIQPEEEEAKVLKTNMTRRHVAAGLSVLALIACGGCCMGIDDPSPFNPFQLNPVKTAVLATAALCLMAFMVYLYCAVRKAQPEAEVALERQQERHKSNL